MSSSAGFALLLILLCPMASTATVSAKWIVAELRSFDVTPSCLTDICRNPRFKNILQIGINQMTSSISLNETATHGIFDRIVGNPVEATALRHIQFYSEVVGLDPAFNFMRICDSSTAEPLDRHFNQTGEREHLELRIRGKCFRATVAISIHTKSCPWCFFEAESVIATENDTDEIRVSMMTLCIGIIALAILIIGNVAICLCFCRLNRDLKRKLRRGDTSSSPSTQVTESQYDLPWKPYGGRTLRLVRAPYGQMKPGVDEFICLSPSDAPSSTESFGVCLGTTHRRPPIPHGPDDHTYLAIPNHCDDSGRDSI